MALNIVKNPKLWSSKYGKVVVMDKYFKAEQFHNRYIQLYEHFVVVTLIDGTTLEGLYNDDFYEDEAILISLIKRNAKQGEKFMEVFLSILVVLIFYLILVILISLIRALFSIRKGKKYAKETFLLLPE